MPFHGKKQCFNVGCAHKFLKILGMGCKMIQNIKNLKKSVEKRCLIVYNRYCCEGHNKVLKTTNQLKGSIAQLGEHLPYKQRVTGSSPVGPIYSYADVAQLAEQLICNQQVIGSSPIIGF